MNTDGSTINKIAPFAVEAAWATGRWEVLQRYFNAYNAGDRFEEFNLGVGSTLLALKEGQTDLFVAKIQELKEKVAVSMSVSSTTSLQAAHESMLRCHVLADLEIIAGDCRREESDQQEIMTMLNRRLEVLGAYVNDKQYVLGIRRAAMELMRLVLCPSNDGLFLLTAVGPNSRTEIYHLYGSLVRGWLESQTHSSSPSTPFSMRLNLVTDLQRLRTPGCCGRKDIIAKQSKFSRMRYIQALS